jgi:hypothetical protein
VGFCEKTFRHFHTANDVIRQIVPTQGVRMHAFLKAGPLRGLVAGMSNGFRIDGPISAMVVLAGKEPHFGSAA